MLTRNELYARQCVADLIAVVEDVPRRAAARRPLPCNADTAALLLFWSLLRWERTFLLELLEREEVDLWGLTCDVDGLLDGQEADEPGTEPSAAHAGSPLCGWSNVELRAWLDRAAGQATAMGHAYLGTEHLLLAILSGAGPAVVSACAQRGLEYARLREALCRVLPEQTPGEVLPIAPPHRDKPWGAGWDTEAVGVPRRFGLAIMMLMVTLYAVLFAFMKLMGAHPVFFVMVGLLVLGVGMGQVFLFGGRFPRAASIWTGACLLPVEVVGAFVYSLLANGGNVSSTDLAPAFVAILFSIPLGAGAGYLAGGLTAGVFLALKHYGRAPDGADAEEVEAADVFDSGGASGGGP